MDSISLGLMEINGLIGESFVDSSALVIGMPSTTYKGSCEDDMVETPRTLTLIPPSTFPLIWVILTPAAFPVSALCKLGVGISLSWSEDIVAILSVTFRLDWDPYPTTITSSNWAASSSI